MMKELYTSPKTELVEYDVTDIIRTSDDMGGDPTVANDDAWSNNY